MAVVMSSYEEQDKVEARQDRIACNPDDEEGSADRFTARLVVGCRS
jgi:hypothetical protein